MLPPNDDQADFNGGTATVPERSLHPGPLVPVQPEMGELAPYGWGMGPAPRPALLSAPPNPIGLLLALKRRWLLATLLAVTLGGILAAIPYFAMPLLFKASSWLDISYDEPSIINNTRGNPQEFDAFKRSQEAFMTNPFVLTVALRDPNVSSLEIIQAQADPLSWLSQSIKTTFPGDANLMQVYMQSENKDDAIKIVDAVVTAYMRDVANARQGLRRARLDELEKTQRELTQQIASQRTNIASLASTLGGKSVEVVQQQLRLHEQELLNRQREKFRLGQEIARLDVEVKMLQAQLEQAESQDPVITELQVEQALFQDRDMAMLQNQLNEIRRMHQSQTLAARDAQHHSLRNISMQLEQINDEIQQRKAELRGQLLVQARTEQVDLLKGEIGSKQHEMQLKQQQYEAAEAELITMTTQVDTLTTGTEDLEGKREQLRSKVEFLSRIDKEVEQLRVELKSPNRIRLVEPAFIEGNNQMTKYALTGFCGLVGVSLALLGVALLEFQSRRVSSPLDVSEGLGLRVIGLLPTLTSRSRNRLLRSGEDPAATQVALAESIDGIRTALLHADRREATRVVMVTSSAIGEGKTTLATQLAASLARAGRRTLLIDGDLRTPAAHRLFDLPLEPGFSELLRGEAETEDVVRPTRVPGLWIITAGHSCRECVQALAQERAEMLFHELRSDFEFVIVDSQPVLTTSDSLSLGQHVDAAIISVLKDQSQAPRAYEANERLEAVGIRVLGTVVGGVGSQSLRRVPGLPNRSAQGSAT